MNGQSAGNRELKIYNQTGSIHEVAKQLDIPYGTAWSRLKKQGVVSKKKKPVYSTSLINDYFYNIDSSIKAYFLGFIKADGYVDKKRNRLAIRVQERDEIILKYFCDAVNLPVKRINKIVSNPNSRYYSENRQDCVEVAITNEIFVKPLMHVKTEEILKVIPEEFAYDFIRGYFDGDGGIYYTDIKKKKFSMSIMGSPKDNHVLEYIKHYFPFFYTYMDNRSDLPFIKSGSMGNILEFREKIYNNSYIYLPRKKQKFDYIKFLFEGSSTTTRGTSSEKDEDIVSPNVKALVK